MKNFARTLEKYFDAERAQVCARTTKTLVLPKQTHRCKTCEAKNYCSLDDARATIARCAIARIGVAIRLRAYTGR
ncbi:MAG: hypothetical protein ACR2K5_09810 [Pseudolabrys sp.]